MPTVENSEDFWLGRPLNLHLAARLLTATTFSGGAAGLHATREVVAGKHDLEVVGDEGTHIAVARHLEFSDCKGTKKARETSKIVGSEGNIGRN